MGSRRFEGKVALVTGAARGQGRSHARELAREGADVILLDVAGPLAGVDLGYELATHDELADAVAEVEALGARAHLAVADIRDDEALTAAIDAGVSRLGRLDVVVANAGLNVPSAPTDQLREDAWMVAVDVNLNGTWRTCKAATRHVRESGGGGAFVLVSSMAGLRGYRNIAAYSAAKHGMVGLMRVLAAELGPDSIRVNTVHPTQVDTPMIMNDGVYRVFSPDLESPTREDFRVRSAQMHALPVPWIDPVDISRAVLFLASDDARYITGVTLPVDAGLTVR